MLKRIGKILFLTLLMLSVKFALNYQVQLADEDNSEQVEEDFAAPAKKKTNNFRSVSSTGKPLPLPANPKYATRTKDQDRFKGFNQPQQPLEPEVKDEDQTVYSAPPNQRKTRRANFKDDSSPDREPSNQRDFQDTEVSQTNENDLEVINSSAFMPAAGGATIDVDKGTPPSSNGSFETPKPVCSADIGSGSFSTPIGVNLTCTTASTISYCISEVGCCDPRSGAVYSGTIPVGAEAKTYCVSFMGEDAEGNQSNIVENSYTFNPSLPDIQVAHAKTYYQTTQLRGLMSVASMDFGTSSTVAGVLNLKNSDPALNGLMTCEDIVENSGFLSPVAALPATNVGHLSPTDQIDVELQIPQLVYGDNFLTSYIQNSAFGNVYSCSTTNVVLQDFPYFETLSSNAVINGASIMEFSGGFTSVGFFEAPQPVLARGPAGSSTEDQAGQELRAGLAGIFY